MINKHLSNFAHLGGAILILLLSVFVVSCSSEIELRDYEISESDGNITYLIYTAEGLMHWNTVAYNHPNINARLMADIILPDPVDGGSNWRPIGYYDSSNGYVYYTGTFDGNNKTISNMKISEKNLYEVGMFGVIGYGGEVKNLGLIEAEILGGNPNSFVDVGSIAGYNVGTITACYNTGNISDNENNFSYIGGIAGYNSGSIIACYNTGDVSGSSYDVGGIAGYNEGTITGCYNMGKISGSGDYDIYVSGIAGYNLGYIIACYNTGKISGSGKGGTYYSDPYGSYFGGIAGYNYEGTITACYSTGGVEGSGGSYGCYVGGIAGSNSSASSITACFWSGEVKGNDSGEAKGVGSDKNSNNPADVTEVDGSSVSWTGSEDTSAKNKMNEALSEAGVSYQYVGDIESADPPLTLTKT